MGREVEEGQNSLRSQSVLSWHCCHKYLEAESLLPGTDHARRQPTNNSKPSARVFQGMALMTLEETLAVDFQSEGVILFIAFIII